MGENFLRQLFEAAVSAADPAVTVPKYLPGPPEGRTVVIGAGKAAASMARAVEEHWQGPLSGLAVTRHGHGVTCDCIDVIEAAHPVPDATGEKAARRALELADGLGPDDLLLCLMSGGGSALLNLAGPGLTLADKQTVNAELLRSGATISEMNCVRKHLSAIKGGRLAAAAYPARVLTLAISDVPGDDPAVIASGPTVADPTSLADARAVLDKYGIDPGEAVARALNDETFETLKSGNDRLMTSEMMLIATPAMALAAAAETAAKAGIEPVVLGDAIEGEARDVAREHAALAERVGVEGGPAKPPCVLLSGGETTVTIKGSGRGGRNAEYLLALAIALDGRPGVSALACDTDGIDGSEDNAGGVIDPTTLDRARALGLDAPAMLADNDAYGFFSALGDLVVTGPTLTNVNDFRAILVQ